MTEPDAQPAAAVRILLVEDALDQAVMVRAMLGDDLFQVVHTQDGVHAREVFESGEFDLVITDLNLPGMDGFELTRALKSHAPEVPVLAVTGYSSPGYADAAFRAGVDAILRKPLEREELLRQVRELLPDRDAAASAPAKVLALGSRPGDVLMGCGGTLAFHRAQGHDVLIFILSAGEPGSGLDLEAARRGASELGARVIVAGPHDPEANLLERQGLLDGVVREFSPQVGYIPTLAETDPYRKAAHHLGRAALSRARAVLAYATPTATLDFRPAFYKAIERHLPRKLLALEAFSRGNPTSGAVSARFAEAAARYWGRFANFGEVEPFEVIRDEGNN